MSLWWVLGESVDWNEGLRKGSVSRRHQDLVVAGRGVSDKVSWVTKDVLSLVVCVSDPTLLLWSHPSSTPYSFLWDVTSE